jgi:hypothetical protein
MRRYDCPVRRRLLNLVTLLSLLVFVAVCVLWVRSYWARDGFIWMIEEEGPTVELASVYLVSGAAAARRMSFTLPSPHREAFVRRFRETDGWYHYPPETQGWRADLIPQFLREEQAVARDTTLRETYLQLPFWLPALLASLLPGYRLASAWRTRRRRNAKLCPRCGYDLRATPDRCPECGAGRLRRG